MVIEAGRETGKKRAIALNVDLNDRDYHSRGSQLVERDNNRRVIRPPSSPATIDFAVDRILKRGREREIINRDRFCLRTREPLRLYEKRAP